MKTIYAILLWSTQHKCKNYFNDPNKKKQQHERGVRFAREKPKKVGVHLTSTNINQNRLPVKRKHTAVTATVATVTPVPPTKKKQAPGCC
jgi:hypothetical protein